MATIENQYEFILALAAICSGFGLAVAKLVLAKKNKKKSSKKAGKEN